MQKRRTRGFAFSFAADTNRHRSLRRSRTGIAAQGLVQRHLVFQLVQADLRQRVLGAAAFVLLIQPGLQGHRAGPVTQFVELFGCPCHLDVARQQRLLPGVLRARRKGVLDVAEGGVQSLADWVTALS